MNIPSSSEVGFETAWIQYIQEAKRNITHRGASQDEILMEGCCKAALVCKVLRK